MLIDFLHDTLISGGIVLLPILIIGALGFYFVGLASLEVGAPGPGNRLIQQFDTLLKHLERGELEKVDQLLKENHSRLKPYVRLMINNRHLSRGELEILLQERVRQGVLVIDRHIPLVHVFAAVAPLLGLLGTVMGMVQTFNVITVFGNSNPMLMADGISQALITTQSGLVIAFPLVLMNHRIQERIDWLKKQLELIVTQFFNHQYESHPNKESTANGTV